MNAQPGRKPTLIKRGLAVMLLWGAAAYYLATQNAPSTAHQLSQCKTARTPAAERILACSALLDTAGIADISRSRLLTWRALAFRAAAQYQLALADIDAALTLWPERPYGHVARALINDARGDFEASDADFERALALDPARVYTYSDRADRLIARGHLDRALADFEQILILAPDNSNAAVSRVLLRAWLGRIDEAIAEAEQLAAAHAETAPVQLWLGSLHYLHSDQTDKAIAALLRGEALGGEQGEGPLFLAASYFRLGDEARALQYVDRFAATANASMEESFVAQDRAMISLAQSVHGGGDALPYFRAFGLATIGQADHALDVLMDIISAEQFAHRLLMETLLDEGLIPSLEGFPVAADARADILRAHIDSNRQRFVDRHRPQYHP